MLPCEVNRIFEKQKNRLLANLYPSNNPIAIILGGQPASGKGSLFAFSKREYKGSTFLEVNGDVFRQFHPDFDVLMKDHISFSSKTQIFSNVFTERLIDEATKNKFNIIIEGTMRNPDIPSATAKKFRDAGFKVEAYIIAAPSIVSELGIYDRYNKEVASHGCGRLSDIESHNQAVQGLLVSADRLYKENSVDKISIFSFQAQNQIQQYNYIDNHWNCPFRPSEIINKARNAQLENKEFIQSCLERAENLHKNISNDLKPFVSDILDRLQIIKNNIRPDKSFRYCF
jgi:hypothetical protein